MSCTVIEYAKAKFLPIEFLAGIGLKDISLRGASAIEIPYPGADCVRYRLQVNKLPDGDRRFEWKTTGSKPTFYGLDRLKLAKERGYVVLVEGESDAQTMWFCDYAALGVPGASMLNAVLGRSPQAFDGIATIYVINERDGGAAGLLDTLRKSTIANRVKVIDLAPHKDPSEVWCKLAKGVSLDQAKAEFRIEFDLAMADAVPLVVAEPITEPASSDLGSELNVADALVDFGLGSSLRFIVDGPTAGPRVWDGHRWASCTDPIPLPLQIAVKVEVARRMRLRAMDVKDARRLESAASLRAIFAMVQSHPPMQMRCTDLDIADTINTPYGPYDLRTGTIGIHDPLQPITRCTVAPYAGQHFADPLWSLIEEHLDRLPNDGHGIIRRYVGAAAVGRASDRKLLWLFGDGGDGKSTLLRILGSALGDYASAVPAEALADGGGRGAHGNELLSPLMSARLVAATEVPPSVNWPLLKAISGGDARTTKRLHGRAFTFEPRCHLIIASNSAPMVPHGDQAARDRVVLIRWLKPPEPEPELVRVLATPGPERDSLLRAAMSWIVRGAREFIKEGYGVVEAAPTGYEPPTGIAAWFAGAVDSGGLLPGVGWTPARDLAIMCDLWHSDHQMAAPTSTALGNFLRTVAPSALRGAARLRHYKIGVRGSERL